MTDSDNVATVKAFLDAQYAGDLERAFDENATRDFGWVVSTVDAPDLTRAIPWAGARHTGKSGYVAFVSALFDEFEALEFTPQRFTDAVDQVFMQGRFVFRHRNTGKQAVSDFLARFDMRDGRIAGGQFYENTHAVAAARVVDQ